MRSAQLDQPADLMALDADLQPQVLDWLWIGIRTQESTAPAAVGLRSTAALVVRSWWDDRLLPGRYLLAGTRLLHIDNVRDVMGTRVEVQIAATELVGEPATYLAAGVPVRCRVHLTRQAPVISETGQVVDYKNRAEVALIEVGRPQRGDQLDINGRLYDVVDYADGSDDGIVRGLWLEDAQ